MKEKILGERLKILRGKKTQEEVATRLGLSRARYSHYENDRVEPDTQILNKMADYFNVSVDYLLGRIDDEKPINIAFRDGGESITDEEEEYLQEQLETFRRMKKRFMEQRNKETK